MKRGTKVVSNHGPRSARARPAKALAVGVLTLPGLEDVREILEELRDQEV